MAFQCRKNIVAIITEFLQLSFKEIILQMEHDWANYTKSKMCPSTPKSITVFNASVNGVQEFAHLKVCNSHFCQPSPLTILDFQQPVSQGDCLLYNPIQISS